MREMIGRLYAVPALAISSFVIGILTTTVTVFLGRSAGISFLIIASLFYAGMNYLSEKRVGESAFAFISALLIGGVVAVVLGYILVNYILDI